MSGEIQVTELDFDQIKENIKTFLKTQSQFTDYDLEGSGLNVLIDVLAYNTHFNALLAHLQANEQFIDTAVKRSSIVSIAKTLGYIPRSSTTSRAAVKVVVTPSGAETSLTMGSNVKFTTSVNGTSYTFNNEDTRTVVKENGVFTFGKGTKEDPWVSIIEGTRLTNSFLVAPDTVSGPFIIPNSDIDLATVQVKVQTSANNITARTFTHATTIIDVGSSSNVFWIEENPDGRYQLIFGDNVIGKALDVGNIVTIAYVACNGNNANNATTFALAGTIDGEVSIVTTTESDASGGSFRETLDEVRFNAPKFNATRNRAVTAQDYKSLILAKFPRAQSVAVWGGEENVPPIFGKVFITIDAREGELITEADKNYIITNILRPRSVMSIQHEFVDPDYMYMGFDIDVRYNPRDTTMSSYEIASLVGNQIEIFFSTTLRTLDRTFFYSQFVDSIQALLPNTIVGILTKVRLQRRLDVTINSTVSKTMQFLTAVIPSSVLSTKFSTTINRVNYTAYIVDNGEGNLTLREAGTDIMLNGELGTINYQTGVFGIKNLIAEPLNENTGVRIHATPQELSLNISPKIVPTTEPQTAAILPAPSRNTIIDLDDSTVDVISGLAAGVSVTVTPYIETV